MRITLALFEKEGVKPHQAEKNGWSPEKAIARWPRA
jgi:hypothetical protein